MMPDIVTVVSVKRPTPMLSNEDKTRTVDSSGWMRREERERVPSSKIETSDCVMSEAIVMISELSEHDPSLRVMN